MNNILNLQHCSVSKGFFFFLIYIHFQSTSTLNIINICLPFPWKSPDLKKIIITSRHRCNVYINRFTSWPCFSHLATDLKAAVQPRLTAESEFNPLSWSSITQCTCGQMFRLRCVDKNKHMATQPPVSLQHIWKKTGREKKHKHCSCYMYSSSTGRNTHMPPWPNSPSADTGVSL